MVAVPTIVEFQTSFAFLSVTNSTGSWYENSGPDFNINTDLKRNFIRVDFITYGIFVVVKELFYDNFRSHFFIKKSLFVAGNHFDTFQEVVHRSQNIGWKIFFVASLVRFQTIKT